MEKTGKNGEQKLPETRLTLGDRLTDFLTRIPVPLTVYQFSSRYLSGIRVSPRDHGVEAGFVLPLEPGVILSSFYKPNLLDPERLEILFKQGRTRLGDSDHKVGLLLPELSQRVFLFSFEDLPPTPEDREQLIRHRIRKQMPLLPEDNRLTFDTILSGKRIKVVAAIARESVIREYEDFLQRVDCRVRLVGIPSLGLYNLLADEKEKNFGLVDIEEDSFSFIAVFDSELFLYRQKPLSADEEGPAFSRKLENVFQEILNTTRVIEDKEEKRIGSLWVRLGFLDDADRIFSELESRLDVPVKRILAPGAPKINRREGMILTPLIGQTIL